MHSFNVVSEFSSQPNVAYMEHEKPSEQRGGSHLIEPDSSQSVSSRSRCIFWWGGPPSQSFAEDLPPAEPFRASLTMAGSAESPSCRCTVMSNTSKSEKHYQCVKVITGPTRLKALFHFWVINVNDCVWSIETLLIVVGKCRFCFM